RPTRRSSDLTSRSSVMPQFSMARAAAPIFSPSCGSTRIMTGPRRMLPGGILPANCGRAVAVISGAGGRRAVAQQLPLDGILQRHEGGIDDVGRDADGEP